MATYEGVKWGPKDEPIWEGWKEPEGRRPAWRLVIEPKKEPKDGDQAPVHPEPEGS